METARFFKKGPRRENPLRQNPTGYGAKIQEMSKQVDEKRRFHVKKCTKVLDFSKICDIMTTEVKFLEKWTKEQERSGRRHIFLPRIGKNQKKDKSGKEMKMTETQTFRRKFNLQILLISAVLPLPTALLSLILTLPAAHALGLPLWSGAALSGLLELLSALVCGLLMRFASLRERENLAILADRIDQPVEFRTTAVFRLGKARCPGYLLLTYDACYLIARSRGGLFSRVDRMETQTIVLRKPETFCVHVIDGFRVMLMPNAREGYELSVCRLKRLIYLMDRDFWRVTGQPIAAYLT